jgi:hypothetical protein
MLQKENDHVGTFKSASGSFIFGVENWVWRDPVPTSVTFFIDGTAIVNDQYGRPIRGVIHDGHETKFAPTPPVADSSGEIVPRPEYANHQQVIEALRSEGIEWKTLDHAGWPQMPYSELVKLEKLPPTPAEALARIVDPALRKDALKMRCEADEARKKELQPVAIEAE